MPAISAVCPLLRHPIRFLAVALVIAAAGNAARPSRTYLLASAEKVGDRSRVQAVLEVGGNLQAEQDEDAVPISVVANLTYEEQLLGGDSGAPLPRLGWRHYEQAQAVIKIGRGGVEKQLDESLRRIVVECSPSGTSMLCRAAPLTRDDLDLIDVVGNSLLLERLLPGDRQAIGDRWQPAEEIVQALLGMDRIRESQVEAQLVQVKSQLADIRLTGTVRGSTAGVDTELAVLARLAFHVRARRVTGITLAVREKRPAGPIGPGLDVTAKLRLKRRWLREPRYLKQGQQPPATQQSYASQAQLSYRAELGNFRLLCDPSWYVTSETPQLTVLRLLDRGDLLAQCNISSLTPRSAAGAVSLTQYRQSVAQSLAEFEARIVEEGERVDERKQLVYRVVAEGSVKELPVTWRYYLVAHPNGQRTALAFTIEAALVERFDDADQKLVGTLELFDPPAAEAETAGRTATEKR